MKTISPEVVRGIETQSGEFVGIESDKDRIHYLKEMVAARCQANLTYGILLPEEYRCLPYQERNAIDAVFDYFNKMKDPSEYMEIDDDTLNGLGLDRRDIKGLLSNSLNPSAFEENHNKRIVSDSVLEHISSTALRGTYQLTQTYYDNWLVRRVRKIKL